MRMVVALICLIIAGCSSEETLSLREIYKQAVQNKDRNPVVLIHGISGARLIQQQTKKIVWGAFSKEAVDPDSREGMRALACPIWDTSPNFQPRDIATINDDIYASAPLEKVDFTLFGISFSVDVYLSILQTLGIGGYRDPVANVESIAYKDDHYTCFTFFYDWRKDNITNAILFGKFLEKLAVDVGRKDKEMGIERREVRFDVVAHSMGGLIARYYLMYGGVDITDKKDKTVTWAGAKRISRLIQVGSPNTGSASAFRSLIEGQQFSAILPKFQPALLATFPSLYQLLPRPRHNVCLDDKGNCPYLDIYDVGVWKENKWGIFADEQRPYVDWLCPEESRDYILTRYVQAALHRAQQFHQALDAKPDKACPAQIFLFASKSIPTLSAVRVLSPQGRLELRFDDDELLAPGDGSVTMANALADERQGHSWKPWVRTNIPFSAIYLLHGDHLGMTTSPRFQNNILHLLLETPPLDLEMQ